MRGGQNRKTNQQKFADGDVRRRGKRKLLEKLQAEPDPRRGYPDCPKHLKGMARYMWNFLVDELAYMQIDHKPDAFALEGACQAYAKAVAADLVWQEEGIIMESESGMKYRHPATVASHDAWTQVRHFCVEFGLTPVSRSRLSVKKEPGKAQELEGLLDTTRKKPVQPAVIVQTLQ